MYIVSDLLIYSIYYTRVHYTQVHVVVGGWLFLRAARPVVEGDELTTCHIGEVDGCVGVKG